MDYSPPGTPGRQSDSTQGDSVTPDQQGRVQGGFDPPYVAQPWDRAMRVMDNEPVTSLADSGMNWDDNCWALTSIHPDSGETEPAPAAGSRWPITPGRIHSGPGAEGFGPPASKLTPPGF